MSFVKRRRGRIVTAVIVVLFLAVVGSYFAWGREEAGIEIAGMEMSQAEVDEMIRDSMGTESLENVPLTRLEDRVDQLEVEANGRVKQFELQAKPIRWEYRDRQSIAAWGYEGQIPGPAIRVTEGDRLRIKFTNRLPEPTTVHWHGVDLPFRQDGVPGVTQEPVKPGETFTYEFEARPAGTRFYHTHGSSMRDEARQLDMGLAGPLIIEPAVNPTPTPRISRKKTRPVSQAKQHGHEASIPRERRTRTRQAETRRKTQAKQAAAVKRTAATKKGAAVSRDETLVLDEWSVAEGGLNAAMSGAGHAAHNAGFNLFTINGRAAPATTHIKVRRGDVVRLRFINAGSSTTHPMHLHGHQFTITAIDGNPVPAAAQQRRNVIPVSPGETYDVTFVANNPGVWMLHCHELHHADAGMMTLLQYDGFEPVSDEFAAGHGEESEKHEE